MIGINMDIKQRITLLIALSVMAIFTIGGSSILLSKNNAAEVKKVTEDVLPSALSSADLVSQVKEMQLITMSMISTPDTNLANQAKDKLLISKKNLQDGVDFQFAHADGNTQHGLIVQTKENLAEYFSAIDETVNFKLSGQSDIADATYFGNVVVLQRELQQIVDTLRIEKSREKDLAIAELNNNLSATVTGVTLLSLAIIIGLGAFGLILYRQIIYPINRMQEATTEIASSQDFTHRVPVTRMDEIGKSIVAFNIMIEKIEENSILLKQKTKDIHTMLQNMPQGILTIAEGNKVHPEYSAYLETIFDTQEIAGQNFMDLVFANSDMGSDTLSQVEAVAAACISEDQMNFKFNSHLLADEIKKTMPDGHIKILDLSWSPILDENDHVIRLMLCIRDVTELRALAAEATKQKRELEIIGEILSVTQEKFHEFIISAFQFLDENEKLIRDNLHQNNEVLTQLFRNMHTIKGNSRTYGLNHLTNIVHEVEQEYVCLRECNQESVWNQDVLLGELHSVREVLEYYSNINEVSLGRKGPGRRGGIEHFLMVDKRQIMQTIHHLEKATYGNIHDLREAHGAVSKTLRLLGTERIIETLEGVFGSLPSLARELGKIPPIVDIQENGYVIHSQASSVLKNVFMHLIRNAMDHGLETPEERIAQNKPQAGLISLEMDVQDGMLQIKLSDDGRGLALNRIRKMAIDRMLVSHDDSLTDQQIANLIFLPGFTTASSVTEVSGRGVGMDAVKDFIYKEKGTIKIRFTDGNIGADFRQFEMVVCLPEMLAESIDGVHFHSAYQDKFDLAMVDFKSNEMTISKQA